MGIGNRKVIAAISICSALIILYRFMRHWTKDRRLTFSIGKTWDGNEILHARAEVSLSKADTTHVELKIRAPFYNDPVTPDGPVGEPFPQLWDYEVVEAFFLSDSGKYLEVEFCPHGQHLILMLDGRRNIIKEQLPVKYTSQIANREWIGTAMIPVTYFPPNVSKFNAYAIHGSGEDRKYESFMAVPGDQPDFHRLEYFAAVDLSNILPQERSISEYWQSIMKTGMDANH